MTAWDRDKIPSWWERPDWEWAVLIVAAGLVWMFGGGGGIVGGE